MATHSSPPHPMGHIDRRRRSWEVALFGALCVTPPLYQLVTMTARMVLRPPDATDETIQDPVVLRAVWWSWMVAGVVLVLTWWRVGRTKERFARCGGAGHINGSCIVWLLVLKYPQFF